MVRECVALSLLAAFCPGCSLVLDFDQGPPPDAAVDAVYTQAECDYLEPNDTLAEAAEITADDTGPAAICARDAGPEDHDFYRFTANGGTVTIAVTFTARPGGDLDLKLYDPMGTLIAQSREFGDTEVLTCPGPAPACPALDAGTYTFEVFPGVAGSVNTYTFSIVQ